MLSWPSKRCKSSVFRHIGNFRLYTQRRQYPKSAHQGSMLRTSLSGHHIRYIADAMPQAVLSNWTSEEIRNMWPTNWIYHFNLIWILLKHLRFNYLSINRPVDCSHLAMQGVAINEMSCLKTITTDFVNHCRTFHAATFACMISCMPSSLKHGSRPLVLQNSATQLLHTNMYKYNVLDNVSTPTLLFSTSRSLWMNLFPLSSLIQG